MESVRNAAASPRCRRKNSGRSPARVVGPRIRRAPLTSGPGTRPGTQAARVARSAAGGAAGFRSRPISLSGYRPTRAPDRSSRSVGRTSQVRQWKCWEAVRMLRNRVVIAVVLTLAVVSSAVAQTTSSGTMNQTTQTTTETKKAEKAEKKAEKAEKVEKMMMSGDGQTRPATTTFMGDTGLWYVPTGEVLPAKKWSMSAYRVSFNDNQGFSNIANWPLTFAFGVGDRAEIFASWVLVSRFDRDIRPLFVASVPGAGGIVPQNPLMADTWSGNQLGDLWIGAKWNISSEWRQQPVAFALRPMIKLPTDKKAKGAGTGKADFALDAVLSKELNERVEVSGYGGVLGRGRPGAVQGANGLRWGVRARVAF